MLGAISRRDVLARPGITIRCFGWRVFLRALVAGRKQTFLSILMRERAFQPVSDGLFEVVERCVRLEQIAKGIYQSLAERFNTESIIQDFFSTLARQEVQHEELLEMCRITAMRAGWRGSGLDPLREKLPLVERQMRVAEVKLRAVRILEDALWLTIEIESSEINRLFHAIVAATDSEFVRAFEVFRSSVREHLRYIHGSIAAFEPSLRPACERMLACCTAQPDGSDSGSRVAMQT
jgi:rubrerythrin